MEVKIGQFSTEDHLTLYYNCWPAQDAAPCVVYLHGLESHVGWFSNLAEFLQSKGINVYAFDRRGSGLNRDNCKNFCFRHILEDLKIFLDLVKKEHPHSKIFLIGLCLGGKIAVSFFSSYPDYVNGLILISPSLKNKVKFSLSDKLSILFRPNSMLKIPIEDGMFTANNKYLKYIGKDSMRLRYIPAQHLKECAKMDYLLKSASANIRLPVLLMLAGIDNIIDTDKTARWFKKLPSGDKTLKVYKDYYHIITFEENADKVMQEISDWIWARNNA